MCFDVVLVGLESSVDDGRQHARFAGGGEVRREDFGLDFPRFVEFGLSQVVKIELDLQLVEGQRATDGS